MIARTVSQATISYFPWIKPQLVISLELSATIFLECDNLLQAHPQVVYINCGMFYQRWVIVQGGVALTRHCTIKQGKSNNLPWNSFDWNCLP